MLDRLILALVITPPLAIASICLVLAFAGLRG